MTNAQPFMKNTFIKLLSGLLLCGCAHQQAAAAGSAADLVQAGKDLVRPDGSVIHVTKRVGSSIEGIQISKKDITITAETGTVQQGHDKNTVRLILNHTKIEVKHRYAATTTMTDEKMSIVL
jgi:hypothetical protein